MHNQVQVYLYDVTDENKLTGTLLVRPNTILNKGETYVKPKDGLYGTPMFDEDKQDWFGMTKEEWLKTNPFHDDPQDSQPSQQQETIASLLKQNASLQKQVKTQATVNATVMKDLAELKSKVKQEVETYG